MNHVDDFLSHLQIERALTDATINAYRGDLRHFEDYTDGAAIEDVDRTTIRGFLRELAERGNGTSSRARRLAALKSFFNFLQEEGYREDNPAAAVRLPKPRPEEPAYLTAEECQRLLEAVGQATDRTRARDIAIFSLMIGTGIRRSEVIGLDVQDLDLERGTAQVLRKGRKQQTLPLAEWLVAALRDYMQERPEVETDALFVSERGTRLSQSALWYRFKHYFSLAGLDEAKASPKTLRHSFATMLLRNGVQLPVIASLMGHKSVATTQIYTHLGDPELRQAAETISPRIDNAREGVPTRAKEIAPAGTGEGF